MSGCRVRVERDTPDTGAFEWAALGAPGRVRERGTSAHLPAGLRGWCELLLPAHMVLLDEIDVPDAQQRRLAGGLRFLVEERAIADPDRLHVVGARAGKDRLAVGIVDRHWLRSVLEVLAQHGLVPTSAAVECLLPEAAPGTWTVVWRGGEGFACAGELQGFPLDASEENAAPPALRLALAESPAGRIVVRPTSGSAAPEAECWSRELGIPVEGGAPWDWAEAPWRARLELLQGEFAPQGAERSWGARLRRPAALAAALLAIASCGIAADWATKARERRALLAEMNAIYRQAFGEGAVVVDAPLQMQRAAAELRRRSGEAGPADFLVLLPLAAERVLDPALGRVQGVSYGQGRLAVSIEPHQAGQLAALLEALRRKSAIPGLEARVETIETQGATSVRLTLRPEGGRWALAKP